MAITGGIKFFEKSKCLSKDGATIVASSGDSASAYMLSMNRYFRWDSVGSDDTTTETITITFPSTTISRLCITDHNLKDFSVTYGAGASAFANVVGIDGATSGIAETAFTENTAYYEFDSVTTTQLNISATKTHIVDAQKYINMIIATEEIGTLAGYPEIKANTSANEKRAKTNSGRYKTQKGYEVFEAKLESEYTSQDDIDIFNTLFEAQEPFLIWPCGARYGVSNFSVDIKNWRLKDIYQVQTFSSINTDWRGGIYISSPFTRLRVTEEV